MLTDTAVRNAKAAGKKMKLADEKDLFLLVTPNGSKWWVIPPANRGSLK
jgi:hypothetical protein